MNSTDKALQNVLRIDSQSAGSTLRVWMKCALAAVRLLVHAREITARHPKSRRKFNRRADFVRYFGDHPRTLMPPR